MRLAKSIAGITTAVCIASSLAVFPASGAQGPAPRAIDRMRFGTYAGGALGLSTPLEIWEREIGYIKRANIGMVRFNADAWDLIEPVQGEYRWEALDRIVDLLTRNDIEILFTVPIASSWNTSAHAVRVHGFDIPKTHFPAKDIAAVEELAFRLAARYRGRIKHWEVWNEPDLFLFWKGKPDAKGYARLLGRVYRALKRGDPGCVVAIGGIAMPSDTSYLFSLLRADRGASFDVMNIHCYAKDAADVGSMIRDTMTVLKRFKVDKPLWITELSTTPDYFKTQDVRAEEREKAVFLVKSFAVACTWGVERIFWHSLRKCGRDAGLPKDFDFGLLDADFSILPAYTALVRFTATLSGSIPEGRVRAEAGLRVYRFRAGDRITYIAWSEKGRTDLALPLSSAKVRITSLAGAVTVIEGAADLRLGIGEEPLYIETASGEVS